MSENRTWHNVTLYSKPGCHLCEVALAELLALEADFNVVLEKVDITTDPQLYEKYKYRIPVMLVDEQVELELRIDRHKLRRALAEGYGPGPK